jgi:hypothetical protein
MVIEGDHVWLMGTGTLNNGQEVAFTIEIVVPDETDQPTTFHLYIPALDGYESGGALTGGNITIH